MRSRHTIATVVALVTLVLMAACASDDDGTAGSTSTTDRRDDATTTTGHDGAPDDTDSTDPADAPALTVADLNVLHGLPLGNCPPETEDCQADARLQLLWAELGRTCPDVITLQEVGPSQQELIPQMLPDLCAGDYQVATPTGRLPVEQWILTDLPVLGADSTPIAGISRTAQLVTVDSDLGPVDVITTHYVASIDRGPCDDQLCPSGVCEDGLDARLCNVRETLEFAARSADSATPTILTGDLNDELGTETLDLLLAEGFVDSWSNGGFPECDPETAENCTSGQTGDGPYDGLDVPDNVRDERIDFVLVRPTDECRLLASDATPLAGEPAAEPVEGMYWASDHSGLIVDLVC